MADPAAVAWPHLFVAGDASHAEALVKFQIVRRPGGGMLILPIDGGTAACALRFFDGGNPAPPPSGGALAFALKLKLPTGLERFSLPIEREEPFAAFLTKVADGRHFPRFAIRVQDLAAQHGRFELLVFNEGGNPVALVKAGLGRAAAELIEDEAFALESLPAGIAGAPRLRGVLRESRVEAFAVEFVPGAPPGFDDEAGVERLLTTWIDTSRVMRMGDTFPWQMLEAGAESQSASRTAWSELGDTACHPVVFNGAFAPWNIRAGSGGWVAMDWERGETAGVPGWDWFHFVIHSAVLERAESVSALMGRLEKLLASEGFRRYAAASKIGGMERRLVLAYLDYAIAVLRPANGLEQLKELTIHLRQHWKA